MVLNLDHSLLRGLAQGAALITRGMTLGVRGVAIDGQNRVCLVRHTYVRGWYLPGGGIEKRESAAEAMVREFREEADVIVDPSVPMRLHGFFFNARQWGRDHIAVYVVPAFTLARAKRPDREIAECSFFPLDALPPDTTRGTRERLDEIREGGRPPACGSGRSAASARGQELLDFGWGFAWTPRLYTDISASIHRTIEEDSRRKTKRLFPWEP